MIFLPGEMKSPARYRPGRPWNQEPSWYLPHQLEAAPAAHGHAPAAILGVPAKHDTKAVGGASGEW